jgi:predicted F0F1-ATPase subunit
MLLVGSSVLLFLEVLWYTRYGAQRGRRKTMSEKKKDRQPNFWEPFALVGQVGFAIAAPCALGVAVGYFIDKSLRDAVPIATFIGLLLGLAAGIYGVYRLVSTFM